MKTRPDPRLCATGCYSMKEIARAFDVHSATVSRIVKWKAINV